MVSCPAISSRACRPSRSPRPRCPYRCRRRSSCRRARAIAAPRSHARLCRYGPAPIRLRPHPKRECVALLLSELMRASATPSGPPGHLPHQMGEGRGGGSDPLLSGLSLDSREVEPGFLFAALTGNRQDGAAYVADAVKRGAVAILAGPDAALPSLDPSIVVIRDANPRRRIALMAAAFAGLQPATIAAVTGTNGKSSTVHFVRHIWTALGCKAASVGTLGICSTGLTRGAGLTTPDPVHLHQDL